MSQAVILSTFHVALKTKLMKLFFSVLRSWSPAHCPHLLQDHHRVPRWGRRVEPHPTEGQERPLRQTTELNSLPSFCVFRMTGLVFNWCGLEHHLNKMCPCRYEGREIDLSTATKLKPDLAISSKYQGKSRLKGFKSIKFDASCSNIGWFTWLATRFFMNQFSPWERAWKTGCQSHPFIEV